MTIQKYIDSINERYEPGNATEHTFRGVLQQLLESIVPAVKATNEPKRQACGAPDYILTKNDIPVGFIEAKGIGDKELDGEKKTGNKEQFDRYKRWLGNIFFTDYLTFHLYREGQFLAKISIAELTDKGFSALPENFAGFKNLLKSFCDNIGQTIKSPKKAALPTFSRQKTYELIPKSNPFLKKLLASYAMAHFQPAQKWLKDRKDRQLEFEDILHYHKIIAALSETDRLMKLIDAVENE